MPNEIVRLYRIYNAVVGELGLSFALCDAHYPGWAAHMAKSPHLVVEKVADETTEVCRMCDWDEYQEQLKKGE